MTDKEERAIAVAEQVLASLDPDERAELDVLAEYEPGVRFMDTTDPARSP